MNKVRWMFSLILCTVFAANINGETPTYKIPSLSEELTESWSFGVLSTMIKDAINSAVSLPWDLIKDFATEPSLDVMSAIPEILKTELAFLIPAGLGLVAAIFVPVISLIFCCCRCCCGNCGAKVYMRDIHKQKTSCKFINGFFVFLSAVILLVMAASIPMSGERLQQSPDMILKSIQYTVDDLPVFMSTFVQDASNLAKETLNSSLEIIKSDLRDLPHLLSTPLTDSSSGYMTGVETRVNTLIDGIDSLGEFEIATNASIDNILVYTDSLKFSIDTMNTNLTNIKSQCVTDGETFCNTLLDGDADPLQIDTSQLTDVASMINGLVSETATINLTQYLTLGNDTFATLPELISNSSSSSVDGVLESLDDIPGELEPMIDQALQAANLSSSDFGMDSILDQLSEAVEMLEDIVPTVTLALRIIGGYVAVIAITTILGLMFGACPVSTMKNTRNCGARWLMCSVVLASFIVLFVLLLGSVILLIGVNLTIICKPIQDLELIEKIVDSGDLFDGQTLGEMLLNDTSVEVSIKYFIQTCRDGGTVYNGLNLGSMFNLSSLFNASSFVPDLGTEIYDNINETMRDINVVDTQKLDNLTDQFTFPVVSGTNSTQAILDELIDVDLQGLADNLTDIANTLTDVDYSNSYRYMAAQLRFLDLNTMVPLKQAVNDLGTNIDGLNVIGTTVQTAMAGLSSELRDLQTFIETQAADTVIQSIDTFMARMLHVADQIIDTVTGRLSRDVGRCQIIGDAYDATTGSICVYFLDSFNVFWASFYVSGIFMIVLMIANCKMGKYFRRAVDDLNPDHHTRYNRGGHANTVGPSNSDVVIDMNQSSNIPCHAGQSSSNPDFDANNNNTKPFRLMPGAYYRVVKERFQRRRGLYNTGSGSPQLLKIRKLDEDLKISRLGNNNYGTLNENDNCIEMDSLRNEVMVLRNVNTDMNDISTENLIPKDSVPESDEVGIVNIEEYDYNEVEDRFTDDYVEVSDDAANGPWFVGNGTDEARINDCTNANSGGDMMSAVFSKFTKVGEHEFDLVALPDVLAKRLNRKPEENPDRKGKKSRKRSRYSVKNTSNFSDMPPIAQKKDLSDVTGFVPLNLTGTDEDINVGKDTFQSSLILESVDTEALLSIAECNTDSLDNKEATGEMNEAVTEVLDIMKDVKTALDKNEDLVQKISCALCRETGEHTMDENKNEVSGYTENYQFDRCCEKYKNPRRNLGLRKAVKNTNQEKTMKTVEDVVPFYMNDYNSFDKPFTSSYMEDIREANKSFNFDQELYQFETTYKNLSMDENSIESITNYSQDDHNIEPDFSKGFVKRKDDSLNRSRKLNIEIEPYQGNDQIQTPGNAFKFWKHIDETASSTASPCGTLLKDNDQTDYSRSNSEDLYLPTTLMTEDTSNTNTEYDQDDYDSKELVKCITRDEDIDELVRSFFDDWKTEQESNNGYTRAESKSTNVLNITEADMDSSTGEDNILNKIYETGLDIRRMQRYPNAGGVDALEEVNVGMAQLECLTDQLKKDHGAEPESLQDLAIDAYSMMCEPYNTVDTTGKEQNVIKTENTETCHQVGEDTEMEEEVDNVDGTGKGCEPHSLSVLTSKVLLRRALSRNGGESPVDTDGYESASMERDYNKVTYL